MIDRRRSLALIFALVVIGSSFSLLFFKSSKALTGLERYDIAREYGITDWLSFSGDWEEETASRFIIFEAWDANNPSEAPQVIPWLWKFATYDTYTDFGWAKTQTTQSEPSLYGNWGEQTLRVRVFFGGANEMQINLPVPVGGAVTWIESWKGELTTDFSGDYIFTGKEEYPFEEFLYDVQWSTVPIIDARDSSILNITSDIWMRPQLMAGNLSDVPEDVLSAYTNLPDDLPAIVRETAKMLKVESDSVYEQALAVARFLHANFEYNSTTSKPLPGEDLVAYFLREKKGVCRHFATAFAVLLRSLGVPVRVVIGPSMVFLDSTSNKIVGITPFGVWNEVYIPNMGWVSMIAGRTGGCCCWENCGEPLLGGWTALPEQRNVFFDPEVIKTRSYSPKEVSEVPTPPPASNPNLYQGGVSLTYPLIVFALAAVLLIFAPYAAGFFSSLRHLQPPELVPKLWRHKGRSGHRVLSSEALTLAEQGKHREAVIACYHRLLYLLYKHKGILKDDAMTPSEFGRNFISSKQLNYNDVTALTILYEEAFFSSHIIFGQNFFSAYSYLQSLEKQIIGD